MSSLLGRCRLRNLSQLFPDVLCVLVSGSASENESGFAAYLKQLWARFLHVAGGLRLILKQLWSVPTVREMLKIQAFSSHPSSSSDSDGSTPVP